MVWPTLVSRKAKEVNRTSPGEGQTSCKVWLISVEQHRCNNEVKTRNPLKFVGVPTTRQPISAVNGPSSYCEDICRRYRCLTSFCPIVRTCLTCEDTARESCAMVHRWRFLRNFCILYLQQTTCSTFQTCILNSH